MRHAVRGTRTPLLAAAALAASLAFAGCGSGGGGSGGVDAGPIYWAVPLVTDSSRPTLVLLRNLVNTSAVATLQGYRPSGLPYSGPVVVTLDGFDEHSLAIDDALGGDTPAGGWILVTTPSRLVEVGFDVDIPGKVASESARAWPLPDLAA